jgi:hypothetical protein
VLSGAEAPGGNFWVLIGPDEGGVPIANPAGDNIIGWNQTAGFVGRNISLFGHTRIGDNTASSLIPLDTTYNLLVSGRAAIGTMPPSPRATLEVDGPILPGRHSSDAAADARMAPPTDGAIYYNDGSIVAAERGVRVRQAGSWRAFGVTLSPTTYSVGMGGFTSMGAHLFCGLTWVYPCSTSGTQCIVSEAGGVWTLEATGTMCRCDARCLD